MRTGAAEVVATAKTNKTNVAMQQKLRETKEVIALVERLKAVRNFNVR